MGLPRGLLPVLLLCATGLADEGRGGSAAQIEHVVVLMEENRAFDHFFGWAGTLLGVDGLSGKEYNLVDPGDPTSERVYVDDKAPYINQKDPDHGTPGTTSKIFGSGQNATMSGFVGREQERGGASKNWAGVMSGFAPDRLPVITALAQEFAVMDRFFCSHPGPTWPNRMFMLSATSAGSTETGPWYQNQPGSLFPQKTFFDQIREANMTWRNYYNDTPWELFMAGVAHHPENLRGMDEFWRDAREGALPAFSWLNPRSGINLTTGVGSNDQHPDHDVAAGEAFYKDIYEALRASPVWNKTLFVITFDEHGGFYDHVPPPSGVPPPGDGHSSYPDKGFGFDRLGVRIPTLLISPWVQRGTVISAPPVAQRPQPNSEYDLTSIMATVRRLLPGLGSAGALTKRDAWAATFEHALSLAQPRGDCPQHLPAAPPRTQPADDEAALPVNDLQRHLATVHHFLAEGGAAAPHAGLYAAADLPAQGGVSAWLQRRFRAHRGRALSWRRSQAAAPYAVQCGPRSAKGWAELAWDVHVNASFPAVRAAWNTVRARALRAPGGAEYCLTYRPADPAAPRHGGNATVSECYPGVELQGWLLPGDATFRPAADPSLCLTVLHKGTAAGFLPGRQPAAVLPCNATVAQHWAYHGRAPGDGGNGQIYHGDATDSLGLVQGPFEGSVFSYFFEQGSKPRYVKYNSSSHAVRPDSPSAYGNASFPGIPTDLAAAVPHYSDGRSVYFFKGSEYWKYDLVASAVEAGYPKTYGTTSLFPAVPADLDAAVPHPNDGKSVYFFKGGSYWKYDMTTGKVMSGYPKTYGNSTGRWPGIPADVDAAIPHWSDGHTVFFFKGAQVWQYDITVAALLPGYPQPFGAQTGNFQGVPNGLAAAFNRCGADGPPQFGASCY